MLIRILITILLLSSNNLFAEDNNKQAADAILQCAAVFGNIKKIAEIADNSELVTNSAAWYTIYFQIAQDLTNKEYVHENLKTYLHSVWKEAHSNTTEMGNFLQEEANRCMKLEGLPPEVEASLWELIE